MGSGGEYFSLWVLVWLKWWCVMESQTGTLCHLYTTGRDGVTLRLVLETLPTLQRSVWGGEVIIVYNAVLKWVRDLNIGSLVTPAPDTGGASPGTGEEAETGWKLGVVISASPLCLSSDSQTTMNPNCAPAQAPPTQNNKWVAKCASGTWETGQTGGCVTLLEHLCIRA